MVGSVLDTEFHGGQSVLVPSQLEIGQPHGKVVPLVGGVDGFALLEGAQGIRVEPGPVLQFSQFIGQGRHPAG